VGEEEPEWKEPVVRIGAQKMWDRMDAQDERIRSLEQKYWGVIAGLVAAIAHIYGGWP
jgi:hypothetical protein